MPTSGKGGVLLADSRLSGAWWTMVFSAELLLCPSSVSLGLPTAGLSSFLRL